MKRAALLVGAAVAIACSACGGADATGGGPTNAGDVQRGGVATGTTASDFSARDIEGKTVRLSDYLGKKAVVLNFWATWCEPCVAEFPHLRKMYEKNKDKGFIILGVAMDGPESVANVAPFVRRQQLNFPVLLDEDSHVAAIYNPKKDAPLSVLIDRQGRIFKIRSGYNPGDEDYFNADVAKMLDGSSAPQ